MRAITVIRSLGPIDARSITRDSMLRWLVVFAPVIGLFGRYGVPLVTARLDANFGFDLVPYYPLIMSFLGIAASGILGTVIGFLLLDQRDDRTLPALLVTPLSLGDYLRYRLVVPMVVGTVLTAVILPLAGLTELTVAQVVVTSICGAPLAALYAMFIGSFAANKVQGFALAKGIGILAPPLIIAWFVPSPWQELFGVIPQYWALKVFWLFDEGSSWAWLYAIIGLAWQAVLVVALARWFGRVVLRE